MVAEDTLRPFTLHEVEHVWVDRSYGIHELTQDIHNRHIRIGRVRVVVVLLGRADVQKGRHLAGVIERFLHACKIFRKTTKFVLAGLFPGPFDGRNWVNDYKSARRYIEERVSVEHHFTFCRTAERFTNGDGTLASMFNDEGLTDTGSTVLASDLQEAMD